MRLLYTVILLAFFVSIPFSYTTIDLIPTRTEVEINQAVFTDDEFHIYIDQLGTAKRPHKFDSLTENDGENVQISKIQHTSTDGDVTGVVRGVGVNSNTFKIGFEDDKFVFFTVNESVTEFYRSNKEPDLDSIVRLEFKYSDENIDDLFGYLRITLYPSEEDNPITPESIETLVISENLIDTNINKRRELFDLTGDELQIEGGTDIIEDDIKIGIKIKINNNIIVMKRDDDKVYLYLENPENSNPIDATNISIDSKWTTSEKIIMHKLIINPVEDSLDRTEPPETPSDDTNRNSNPSRNRGNTNSGSQGIVPFLIPSNVEPEISEQEKALESEEENRATGFVTNTVDTLVGIVVTGYDFLFGILKSIGNLFF